MQTEVSGDNSADSVHYSVGQSAVVRNRPNRLRSALGGLFRDAEVPSKPSAELTDPWFDSLLQELDLASQRLNAAR